MLRDRIELVISSSTANQVKKDSLKYNVIQNHAKKRKWKDFSLVQVLHAASINIYSWHF